MLGNGDAVDVGVGKDAVGVGEDGRVLAVGIHPGEGAAVPFQRGGGGAQQVRGVGVKNFAVLYAGFRLLKLVEREEVGGKAQLFGGFLNLGFVGVCQKFLINADITAHKSNLL